MIFSEFVTMFLSFLILIVFSTIYINITNCKYLTIRVFKLFIL